MQKRWREDVRELGCIFCGGPAEIHHVVGRTAKHMKMPVGHWWILPVCTEGHRTVERETKEDQKIHFKDLCIRYRQHYGDLPFPASTLLAIWDWHR